MLWHSHTIITSWIDEPLSPILIAIGNGPRVNGCESDQIQRLVGCRQGFAGRVRIACCKVDLAATKVNTVGRQIFYSRDYACDYLNFLDEALGTPGEPV